MKTIHHATAKKIANLPAPKSPLKGAGYNRESFDFSLSQPLAKELWNLIPSSHKDEIAHRRQKGFFGWSKIISPEAGKASRKIQLAIREMEKASAEARDKKKAAKAARVTERRRNEWLAAAKATISMVDSYNDQIADDGQMIIFKGKRAKAPITFIEAQEAVRSCGWLHPYTAARQAAFRKLNGGTQTEETREIVFTSATFIDCVSSGEKLTKEEIAEFVSLVNGHSHPFGARATEIKNKSGHTWNQLTSRQPV